MDYNHELQDPLHPTYITLLIWYQVRINPFSLEENVFFPEHVAAICMSWVYKFMYKSKQTKTKQC